MSIIVKTQAELDKIPLDTQNDIFIEFGTAAKPAVVRNKYIHPVVVLGNSSIKAFGKSSVIALGSSSVKAFGNSSVVAFGSSSVVAFDNSSVKAFGNSSVIAWNSSSVATFDSSSVVAKGNVQVADKRTAKWVSTGNALGYTEYHCSECNNYLFLDSKDDELYNYCPYCGAKMDKE